MKIGYQMKQVRERIAKGLVDKGVLRTEKKNFVLFDMATHPLADSVIKTAVTRKVIDTLLGRGTAPDIRTICLICAAFAGNVLETVLSSVTFNQREAAFQKAEEILNAFCQLNEKTREAGTNDIVAAVCTIYSKVN
jgi:Golgi phosphoprotein 3